MDTLRTKEKIQALLGFVELCRLGKRKVVFWSYTLMVVAVTATVALAFFGFADPYVFVAVLTIAGLSGVYGYTISHEHKRWKQISRELRSWLQETERLLQAAKTDRKQ